MRGMEHDTDTDAAQTQNGDVTSSIHPTCAGQMQQPYSKPMPKPKPHAPAHPRTYRDQFIFRFSFFSLFGRSSVIFIMHSVLGNTLPFYSFISERFVIGLCGLVGRLVVFRAGRGYVPELSARARLRGVGWTRPSLTDCGLVIFVIFLDLFSCTAPTMTMTTNALLTMFRTLCRLHEGCCTGIDRSRLSARERSSREISFGSPKAG
jgi:hypothetical protein